MKDASRIRKIDLGIQVRSRKVKASDYKDKASLALLGYLAVLARGRSVQ